MYWSLKIVRCCIYLWLSLLIIIVIRLVLAFLPTRLSIGENGTPLYWDEVGERKLEDVELIKTTSKD